MTQAFPLLWPHGWPRAKGNRLPGSQFKTTWPKTLDGLRREFAQLGVKDFIISSNAPLRRDGTPYADAAQDRIANPGVAVYFTMMGKPRVMARDAFDTVHHNLHSIKLAIEAMRALERHGGGLMMERAFEGFTALEGPGAKSWWLVLQIKETATATEIEAAYRKLAADRHPDRGGSEAMMSELNVARDAARKARA